MDPKRILVNDTEAFGINQHMSHPCPGDWGCLAEIQGAKKYLTGTGETSLPPSQPLQNHTGVLVGNPLQTQIWIMTADNNLLKQDYHTLLGFQKDVEKNFRDTVNKKYYKQLKEPVFL